jgi:hypothetical protein
MYPTRPRWRVCGECVVAGGIHPAPTGDNVSNFFDMVALVASLRNWRNAKKWYEFLDRNAKNYLKFLH